MLSSGLIACDRPTLPVMLQPGVLLPGVELPGLDGQPYLIFPGSGPFLLNFWATWCAPCRAEMAALDRLYKALQPRGLKVIGISVDTDIFLVQEYLLKEALSFPILLDAGGSIARSRFQVPAYPATYLVDPAGRVAGSWLGEQDWKRAEIRQQIAQVL